MIAGDSGNHCNKHYFNRTVVISTENSILSRTGISTMFLLYALKILTIFFFIIIPYHVIVLNFPD